MPRVIDGGFKEDPWRRSGGMGVADALLLDFDLWEESSALRSAARTLGIEIGVDAPLDKLQTLFPGIELIAVRCAAFTDGRCFSVARRLRRAGWEGRLRAVGPLIPDQYAFARACGFDEIEISAAQAERQPEAQWLAAAASISAGYQRGYALPGDGLSGSILDRRRNHRSNLLPPRSP